MDSFATTIFMIGAFMDVASSFCLNETSEGGENGTLRFKGYSEEDECFMALPLPREFNHHALVLHFKEFDIETIKPAKYCTGFATFPGRTTCSVEPGTCYIYIATETDCVIRDIYDDISDKENCKYYKLEFLRDRHYKEIRISYRRDGRKTINMAYRYFNCSKEANKDLRERIEKLEELVAKGYQQTSKPNQPTTQTILTTQTLLPTTGASLKFADFEKDLSELEERIERSEDMEVKLNSRISSLERDDEQLKNETAENKQQLKDEMTANKKLRERIEKLEELVAKGNQPTPKPKQPTTQTILTTQTTLPTTGTTINLQCMDGVLYKGKCYFAIMRDVEAMGQKEGEDLCFTKDAAPADLLNLEHERLVTDYIRLKRSIRGEVYVWLGMTYTYSTSVLRWTNGDKVPEDVATTLRWWGDAPFSAKNFNGVAVFVDANKFGIFNYYPAHKFHGVLCEK